MEWFIKGFIRASLLWFAAGTLLGLAIVIHPAWIVYRPAHAHMNVVGFLTMLVFGVGYQLLPRLFGHSLYAAAWLMGIGGSLFGIGALCWVYNLWRTFNAADARERARAATPKRPLPTVGE